MTLKFIFMPDFVGRFSFNLFRSDSADHAQTSEKIAAV
jgi:hypothetical protein